MQCSAQSAVADPPALIDAVIHIMAKERVITASVELFRSDARENQERDEVMAKEKEEEEKDGIKIRTSSSTIIVHCLHLHASMAISWCG